MIYWITAGLFLVLFFGLFLKERRTVLLGLSLNLALVFSVLALQEWRQANVIGLDSSMSQGVNVFMLIVGLFFIIPILFNFVVSSFYTISSMWKIGFNRTDLLILLSQIAVFLAIAISPIVSVLNQESAAGLFSGLIFTLSAALMLLYHAYLLSSIINYFRFKQSFDYIIVLGALLSPEGKVEGLLKNRCDKAYKLYKDSVGVKLIVTGGVSHASDEPESFAMRDYFLHLGVPAEDIIVESDASSTIENIEFSILLMEEGSSAIIVTNSFHLLRALIIAKDKKLTAVGLPAKTPLMKNIESYSLEFLKYLQRYPRLPQVFIAFSLLVFLAQYVLR